MFDFFHSSTNTHLRRAMELLREANMARIEHQAAAEHHGALARMYTERAARLEREIFDATLISSNEVAGRKDLEGGKAPVYTLDPSRRLDPQPKG